MMTVAALAIPTILGLLVISALLRDATPGGLLERLSLAFPLGMGLVTMQIFFLALLRIPLTFWYVSSPVLTEIVIFSWWLRKCGTVIVRTSSFNLFNEIFKGDDNWPKKVSLAILTAIAVMKIGSIFLETYLRPIFAWDSFANWSASAKAFFYSHGMLLDAAPEDFFGRGLLNRNANYPPFNPLMQVWMSIWIGHFDEVLVKFWSPLYLLSMSYYLYIVMTRETSRLIALAMIVLFLSSPMMSIHSIEAYSDMPLSVYILFSLIMFLFGMRGKYEYWKLMGLFSAEALFAKDEAPFFVLPLLASAAVFFWQNRREEVTLRKSAVPLFAYIVLAVPWFVFKFSHKLGFGADYVTVALTFRPDMIWKFVLLLASLQNFNVFFIFIPLLMVLAWRPKNEFIFLGVPILCYAIFFVSVYTFTLFFSGRLMFNTAIFRNVLTYYPSICLLTFLLINNIVLRWDRSAASVK